jgi:hypothetical protein
VSRPGSRPAGVWLKLGKQGHVTWLGTWYITYALHSQYTVALTSVSVHCPIYKATKFLIAEQITKETPISQSKMSARNPSNNPAHDGSRVDARRQHNNDNENDDDNKYDDGGTRKRKRNLRKGTHSCWACKRRKEKCTFSDNSDVCTGCLRRSTRCVSQRFADNEASQATAVARTRLQRIEDMVAQMASQSQSQSQRPTGPPTSAPPIAVAETSTGTSQTALPPASAVTPLPTSFCSAGSKTLTQTLHASLPCPQDIQLLRQATARQPVLSAIHITRSYATLRRDGIQPTDGILSGPPPVTAEPILVARYMLQLAIFLQEMTCTAYPELSGLIEPATALMERCATAAISLATRQDDLLGSVESLEAVILESIYQCNSGRLRLSWMAVQRAIRLAQSMGLHLSRISSETYPIYGSAWFITTSSSLVCWVSRQVWPM